MASSSTKVKAHLLQVNTKEELLTKLDELKTELAALRVAKVSGQGGPSKLARIKVIRKSIARVLTVFNQKQRKALRASYRKRKYKPLDLRPKKTRAIRRQLTVKQMCATTVRQQKKDACFPIRKFAIKA